MATKVTAELAANVWKVLVSEGDEVSAGQPLAILESMKMEIPVEAEKAGVVASVAVEEGQMVAEGDVIAEIEDVR